MDEEQKAKLIATARQAFGIAFQTLGALYRLSPADAITIADEVRAEFDVVEKIVKEN